MVAAGVLVPGSRLLIGDVGVNWTRTGFLRILRRMQGIVLGDLEDESASSPPRSRSATSTSRTARWRDGRRGRGGALAIDELPLVALLGCFAEGETVVRGAAELRVKESDRIAGVSRACAGLAPRSRRPTDASWCRAVARAACAVA